MKKTGTIIGVLLAALILGSSLFITAERAIMRPIQWYNGNCNDDYIRNYQAKFQWFEPTCTMPDEAEISEDDLDELQDQVADLKKQLEKIDQRLAKAEKKIEERQQK